jgi:hypothetical protein
MKYDAAYSPNFTAFLFPESPVPEALSPITVYGRAGLAARRRLVSPSDWGAIPERHIRSGSP